MLFFWTALTDGWNRSENPDDTGSLSTAEPGRRRGICPGRNLIRPGRRPPDRAKPRRAALCGGGYTPPGGDLYPGRARPLHLRCLFEQRCMPACGGGHADGPEHRRAGRYVPPQGRSGSPQAHERHGVRPARGRHIAHGNHPDLRDGQAQGEAPAEDRLAGGGGAAVCGALHSPADRGRGQSHLHRVRQGLPVSAGMDALRPPGDAGAGDPARTVPGPEGGRRGSAGCGSAADVPARALCRGDPPGADGPALPHDGGRPCLRGEAGAPGEAAPALPGDQRPARPDGDGHLPQGIHAPDLLVHLRGGRQRHHPGGGKPAQRDAGTMAGAVRREELL